MILSIKPGTSHKNVKMSGSSCSKAYFLGIWSNKFDELKLELDSMIDSEKDSVYVFTMSKAELNKAGLLGQAFDKSW